MGSCMSTTSRLVASSRELRKRKSKSTITTLPNEMLDEIISSLLANSSAEDSLTRYYLETSIMRTSRLFAAIGREILRRNKFVVVRAGAEILQHLENNNLPLWRHNVEQFEDWNCRITISSIDDTSSAVFAQQNTETFVKVLQMLSLALRPAFQLKIEVKAAFDTLSKLGQLRGRSQVCVVSGATGIRELVSLRQEMNPIVHWVRVEARTFYELVDWKMSRAQLSVAKCDWEVAHLMLRDLDLFLTVIRSKDLDFIRQPSDLALQAAFDRLVYCLFINTAIVNMNMVFDAQPLRQTDLENVCNSVVDRWPTQVPPGIIASEHSAGAWLFVAAHNYLQHVAVVQQAEPVASLHLGFLVATLKDLIPRQLFMLQQLPASSTVATYDNELYCLQLYDYDGDYRNGSMVQQLDASVAARRATVLAMEPGLVVVGPEGRPTGASRIPRYSPHPGFGLFTRNRGGNRVDEDSILRYAGEP